MTPAVVRVTYPTPFGACQVSLLQQNRIYTLQLMQPKMRIDKETPGHPRKLVASHLLQPDTLIEPILNHVTQNLSRKDGWAVVVMTPWATCCLPRASMKHLATPLSPISKARPVPDTNINNPNESKTSAANLAIVK